MAQNALCSLGNDTPLYENNDMKNEPKMPELSASASSIYMDGVQSVHRAPSAC